MFEQAMPEQAIQVQVMSGQARPGWALVTGASSGIGAAIARALARRGIPLILTARRLERLEALADTLRGQVEVVVIALDLADPGAPAALQAEIERRDLPLRMLVNNAGYGLPGRYLASDWPAHARFLQVMVTAVSELTWRLLPAIRASGNGAILNVASLAALMPSADGQTLYAPVKSYLVKFSEALSLENADAGVRVVALCPGFTWSEFHDVTGTRASMSKLPSWMWLDADAVAECGLEALARGNRVTVVPGWRYRLLHAVTRHLPDAFLLRRMAKNSRRIRPLD